MKKVLCLFSVILLSSCVSTKSTLKNVDNTAPALELKNNMTFKVTQVSNDPKYGYDPDYPINIYFRNTVNETINQERYFNALAGPNGETLTFEKTGICCPFPTKNIASGAGLIHVYEVSYKGLEKPLVLYVNMYEKGIIQAPKGLTIKP